MVAVSFSVKYHGQIFMCSMAKTKVTDLFFGDSCSHDMVLSLYRLYIYIYTYIYIYISAFSLHTLHISDALPELTHSFLSCQTISQPVSVSTVQPTSVQHSTWPLKKPVYTSPPTPPHQPLSVDTAVVSPVLPFKLIQCWSHA